MLKVYPKIEDFGSKLAKQKTTSKKFILSQGEKNKVLAVYEDLIKYYEVNADDFYQYNDIVGEDSIRYTTSAVMKQIKNKLPIWRARKSNHILLSYVIRVNGIVVDLAHRAFKAVGDDQAEAVLDRWFISYPECELPPKFKLPPKDFDGSIFYEESKETAFR